MSKAQNDEQGKGPRPIHITVEQSSDAAPEDAWMCAKCGDIHSTPTDARGCRHDAPVDLIGTVRM